MIRQRQTCSDLPPARASGQPSSLGVASVFAAILTWGLQAFVGRSLGPLDYAAFMVVWGLVFLEVGLLMGLQQEVTRAIASDADHDHDRDRDRDRHRDPGRTPVLLVGVVVGAAGAVTALGTAPLWGARLFGGPWVGTVLACAVGLLAYAVYNVVNGVLAGHQRWTAYAWSMATEACLRLVLVMTVVLAGAALAWQALALNGAALAWVALLGRREFREAVRQRAAGSWRTLTGQAGQAMLATGCSALMIAGFPVLLQLTSREPLGSQAGVLLAAVVATRAPLLLPLNAFQAVVLTRFVLARDRVVPVLLRLLAVVAVTTAVGAVAAFLVGPGLLRLLYGSRFVISPMLIASLVLGAGLIAMQTLAGSAVMSYGRHRAFATGWVVSAVVVVAVLTTPLSVGTRSSLALALGPVAGLLVNAWVIAGQSRVNRPT